MESVIGDLLNAAVVISTFLMGFRGAKKLQIAQAEHYKLLNTELATKIEALQQSQEDNFSKLTYDNCNEPLVKLHKDIEEYIKDCKVNNREPEVQAKLMAVSMKYSWKFIEMHLEKYLKAHPGLVFRLELLIVRPEVLRNHQFVSWANEGDRNIEECRKLKERLEKTYGSSKIAISLKSYDNIPQWHGWYISYPSNDARREQLFLGRTRILTSGNDYELKVGENEYREFERSTFKHTDTENLRIDLFLNWFTFLSSRAPGTIQLL